MQPPLKICCLVSGAGRTLNNLISKINEGCLNANILAVISSHRGVIANQIARDAGLNLHVIDYNDYKGIEKFSDKITSVLDQYDSDYLIMAGFIRKYLYPGKYEGKIVNIHPSLLPKHGGKGYYGNKVHEAVLKNNDKESGCTVHYVNYKYDDGPIILQKKTDVSPGETVGSLAKKVFELECKALPEAINILWEEKYQKV